MNFSACYIKVIAQMRLIYLIYLRYTLVKSGMCDSTVRARRQSSLGRDAALIYGLRVTTEIAHFPHLPHNTLFLCDTTVQVIFKVYFKFDYFFVVRKFM